MSLFYEPEKTFYDILNEKKNFVFIGEAGSGKSEIALNVAAFLYAQSGKEVDLFDMDQTKPLFRSRDAVPADSSALEGVRIRYQDQYLDAPTLVGGVAASLQDDCHTILDIGGGQQAAKFAGAYSHLLSKDDSVAVYVFNPFRPWSKDIESIDGTMTHILKSIRLDKIFILGNPNLGYQTTAEEVLEGLDRTDSLLEGITKVNSACVRRGLYEEVQKRTDKKIFPIDLFLTYEWSE